MVQAHNANFDLRSVAQELANAHLANDPSLTTVFLAPDPEGREIRLVEISSELETRNEIFAVRFSARPDLGIPFPSTVVLISDDEWQALMSAELSLPESWHSSPTDLVTLFPA
jgi:hypothetical protein